MNYELSANTYGDWVADIYDEMYAALDNAAAVACIEERLTPGARILEFGPGSGRVSIPLAENGYDVVGIELSDSMIDKHREKDVANLVKLLRGDFTQQHPFAHEMDACIILNNTLGMITDQKDQTSVFARAEQALKPGGIFIVETYSPGRLQSGPNPSYQHTVLGAGDRVLLDTVHVDRVEQVMTVIRTLMEAGFTASTVERNRYTWPAELDLMAERHGFELVERLGDWKPGEYQADAAECISIYRN